MHEVFAYLDYRAYLRQLVENRKRQEKGVSQRSIALELGIDPGQFVRILQGKNHLAARFVPAVAAMAGMDDRAAAYFEELLRYAAAGGDDEFSRSLERLQALRGVATHPLAGGQVRYYESTLHAVVRALVGMGPWRGDAAALGAFLQPPRSREEIEDSLQLLEDLQLVHHEPDGTWKLADSHLSPGIEVPVQVLRNYHIKAMEDACTALEALSPKVRDFSSLTLSLDRDGLERLKELARALRQRVQSLSDRSSGADTVYQLGIQAFPVACRREDAA